MKICSRDHIIRGGADRAEPRGHAVLRAGAFTLVELLLSMTILSILMLVVVNVIGIVQQQWTRSNSRVTAFREARMAFDVLTRNVSQATLNTYLATDLKLLFTTTAGTGVYKAAAYKRTSELQFASGATVGLLTRAAGNPNTYPGHGIFFQAPLGVTRLVAANGSAVDTENMVNLLCPRGYFVAWGDDEAFRPPFLNGIDVVKRRFRYRLLEYSPTAEKNRIYFDPTSAGSIVGRKPITDLTRSKSWFQDAIDTFATAAENQGTRGFTRPVADNIIALVISPQLETTANNTRAPESIAPYYEYDSALLSNPGAAAPAAGTQGTQHLLPPLLKITMVALDSAAGERLAEDGNTSQQERLAARLAPLFHTAADYNSPTSQYHRDLSALEEFLGDEKLNYRVFTSTIVLKEARWGL